MNWQAEAIKRLDALAAKLGTTGQYLWAVLIRQSIAQGIADCITAAVCLAVALTAAHFLRVFIQRGTKAKHDWDGEDIVGAIVCSGLLLAFGIGFGVNLYEGCLELANPAYYALTTVLTAVK